MEALYADIQEGWRIMDFLAHHPEGTHSVRILLAQYPCRCRGAGLSAADAVFDLITGAAATSAVASGGSCPCGSSGVRLQAAHRHYLWPIAALFQWIDVTPSVQLSWLLDITGIPKNWRVRGPKIATVLPMLTAHMSAHGCKFVSGGCASTRQMHVRYSTCSTLRSCGVPHSSACCRAGLSPWNVVRCWRATVSTPTP